MEQLALLYRYAVFQNVYGEPKQVGTVLANNYSAANTKAIRLFNNRVWVERVQPKLI